MPPPPAALVFDLDGTLVDSIHDLAAAVSRVLVDHGRRPLAEEDVLRMMGEGLKNLLARAFRATGHPLGDPDLDAILPAFPDQYDARSTEHTRPFPGVIDTLAALRSAGHRLGVATNRPQASADRLLAAVGLAEAFDAVVGGDRYPFRKPDPRHPLAVLELIGGRSDRALVVGDHPVDLAAGHGAGLPVALATWGYARQPYDTLEAEAHLDRFDEIPAVLDRLFP
ncbi:MAG: HAD-IA family hydrolase [Deltaproteobacteria bacterium]|nr:HAD-IA family hydrolase [Deltaproteobacteria bacterium]